MTMCQLNSYIQGRYSPPGLDGTIGFIGMRLSMLLDLTIIRKEQLELKSKWLSENVT